MQPSYGTIRETVISVIKSISPINLDLLSVKNDNDLLTGEPFYLSATEMVYLFFELEKCFQIRFSPKDIEAKRFTTMREIISLIFKEKGEAIYNESVSNIEKTAKQSLE